jgi:hypothetical protein
MTPRITRTGAVISDGRDVEIGGGGSLHLVLLATADETEDARELDGQRVRITIEPEEAQHGSPLDYLAEATRNLTDLAAWHADRSAEANNDQIRRILSLVNTAHLSALNYLRRQP